MALAEIFAELGFLVSLVVASEAARFIVGRKCTEAAAAAQSLKICSLVLSWYSVSITLVLFNKWMVSSWRDGGLTFPIFYTMTHMFLKGVLSGSYLTCVRRKRLPRPRRHVLLGTAFIGMMTGLDVAASNESFLFISVSFFTMLKSASLIFILIIGTLTRVEPCTLQVSGAVLIIAGGIFLTSYGEAKFNLFGFVLVISSELFAAFRWIVTQKLLHGGELGAMAAVLFMAPASTLALAPLVAIRERHEILVLLDGHVALQYFSLVLFPGFSAFLLLLVEVQLVKETSSLTLSVFGNLKSIVTILFAIVVLGESASLLQWLGLLIALLGIFIYSHIKNKAMAVDALAGLGYEALTQEEGDTLPDGDGGVVVIGASLFPPDVEDSKLPRQPSLPKMGEGLRHRPNNSPIGASAATAGPTLAVDEAMEAAGEAIGEVPPAPPSEGVKNGAKSSVPVADGQPPPAPLTPPQPQVTAAEISDDGRPPSPSQQGEDGHDAAAPTEPAAAT